jgi:septal ring factor EnvC (AmiA/AmiB activator)
MIALAASALLLIAAPAGIEQRLEKERAAAKQLAGREAGLLGHLAGLERQVELESRALKTAQQRLRNSTARSAASEAKARAAEAEVARATEALGPRLAARYRLGREGYVRFLLGARSIGDVLRRKRLYNALLEADLDALATLRFTAEGAKAARDELLASRKELAASVEAESDRRSALEGKVAQQKRVLAAVQQEKALHEQAVRELEEAARDLQETMGQLEKAPKAAEPKATAEAPPIRKARGKLTFPVEKGRVEVHFGRAVDRRFGTVTLQHGIDVRSPQGTPVHAVWPGKVVHAGWFKGYGNLLVVDHGGGFYSLMAHLDVLEKAVGDELQQGAEVGTVGDTGSLKGAYLYFELRDGQKPLDPERWLSRLRKVPALVSASPGPQSSASAKAR